MLECNDLELHELEIWIYLFKNVPKKIRDRVISKYQGECNSLKYDVYRTQCRHDRYFKFRVPNSEIEKHIYADSLDDLKTQVLDTCYKILKGLGVEVKPGECEDDLDIPSLEYTIQINQVFQGIDFWHEEGRFFE